MINDKNTIEDIQGIIYCLQIDVHEVEPEFPVDEQFIDLVERIEDKLLRARNKIRYNWFTEALKHARMAHQSFINGDLREVDIALDKCLAGITDGNKVNRRKTSFIIAPDGTVSKVDS